MLKGFLEQYDSGIQNLETCLLNISMSKRSPAEEKLKEHQKKLQFFKKKLTEITSAGFKYPSPLFGAQKSDYDPMAGYEEKSNEELNSQTQELLKKQDQKFGVIIDVTKQIKYAGQEIAKENDVHEELLGNLERNVIF